MVRFQRKFEEAEIAYNFEDVILLPRLSKVEPREIDLKTKFSSNIPINIPLVSSPMDTVTEAEMAIALARRGGIGVIHRNCSADEELEIVKAVKRSESFIIKEVITTNKEAKVGEAAEIMKKYKISGLPVVENNKLVGIITGRDVRFADPSIKVGEAMTKDVVVAEPNITPEEAIELMKKHKVEKLPVIDRERRLVGLITYKDVALRGEYKEATRDKEGRLRVAAAISPFDIDRAKLLSKYADALVIDVAHFHNEDVIEATKKIVKEVEVDVVIGNLGTREGVLDSISKIDRVAGLRVGMGSGSACITTEVTRAGAPTLFAVSQAADALEEIGVRIPIIADGGIRNPGDVALAIAFGASCAMLGYVFASCKESPSPMTIINGRYFKLHRGMGSQSARQKRMALDRYATFSKEIPEGTEIWVPYRGEVASVIGEFVSGIKAAMGYAGASNIVELQENGKVAKVISRKDKLIATQNVEQIK
ncbi:MAG: IMP dehydrogenase [Candidatus Brockarchaeota archaeon]|nr:IMP dehydrogenase [Candidatus Brockarchaeota archaeon]MBO3767819.1 IMP dehydrogenase [Candidatus Brockarchaeota archaeon]